MTNEKSGYGAAKQDTAGTGTGETTAADDSTYPRYQLIFQGSAAKHTPATGPHTDHVNVEGLTVDATIEHQQHDGAPVLLIKLSRKPD